MKTNSKGLLICTKCKSPITGALAILQESRKGQLELAKVITAHFKLYPECVPDD